MPNAAQRLSENVTPSEVLPNLAVTVTVCEFEIRPVLAVKAAVTAPAGTVTEVGTLSKLPLDAIATTLPPAGAGLLRVTTQLLVA